MSGSGHVLQNVTETIYGEIPQQIVNQKYRESCSFYDPNAVKNHQMDSLRVFGTDKPFAESDRRRENCQTQNIIDLRTYGSRYGTSIPDHSEMNFELTEKDPRGMYNLPDFKKIREHSDFRRRKWDYQFSPDGVVQHMEKNLNPYENGIRDQERRYRLKQLLTIFTKRSEERRVGKECRSRWSP